VGAAIVVVVVGGEGCSVTVFSDAIVGFMGQVEEGRKEGGKEDTETDRHTVTSKGILCDRKKRSGCLCVLYDLCFGLVS